MRKLGAFLTVVLLLLIGAPSVALAQPEFLAVGDEIAGWKVVEIERHEEFLRIFFTYEDSRAGVEIGHHGQGAGEWTTDRHRLQAAPDAPPPRDVMVEVMKRLRAYDAQGLPPLARVIAKDKPTPVHPGGPMPSGQPGPTPGPASAAPAPSPPKPEPGRREPDWLWINLPGQLPWAIRQRYPLSSWPWLCLLLGAGWVGLRRTPSWRRWLDKLTQLVERQPWPWLALVLVGMFALRLPHLGEPFTFDAMTQRLFFGSLDIVDIVGHEYADERHPQLFYLVLHFFLWFGHGETVARMPAVLFSLAATVVLFLLARRAMGAVRALTATVLLGLNVAFLIFSREVGDLTLFTFLVLLSTLLLLRAMDRPDRRALVAFALVEAAMFYAYYLAILVALAHGLLLLVRGRAERHRPVSLALGGAMLLALPSLFDFSSLVFADTGVRNVAREFPKHMWGERSIVELWAQLAGHLTPSVEACAVITVVAAIGVFRLARRPWRKPLVFVALTIVVVSTVALGLAVPLVRLKPYYLLFTLPLVLLFTVAGCLGRGRSEASGATRAWGPDVRAGCGVAVVALLLGAYGEDLRFRLRSVYIPSKPPLYRELGERIRREPGPRVVIADPNNMHTILVYYVFPDPLQMYRTCAIVDDGGGTQCHRGDDHLITLTLLPKLSDGWENSAIELLRSHQTEPTWFVHTRHFINEPLYREVQSHCELEGEYGDWGKLVLYRCPARN